MNYYHHQNHSFEKEAGLITGGISLAVTHTLLNLLNKHWRNHKDDMTDAFFQAGVQLGSDDRVISKNTENTLINILGPESLSDYFAGVEFGRALKKINPDERESFLNQLRTSINNAIEINPNAYDKIREAPVLKSLHRYLNGATPNTTFSKKINEALTSKFLSHGINEKPKINPDLYQTLFFLGGGAIHPELFLHFGMNQGRNVISHTNLGKKIVVGELQKGLEGVEPSPTQKKIKDTFISPGIDEPRATGAAIRELMVHPTLPQNVTKTNASIISNHIFDKLKASNFNFGGMEDWMQIDNELARTLYDHNKHLFRPELQQVSPDVLDRYVHHLNNQIKNITNKTKFGIQNRGIEAEVVSPKNILGELKNMRSALLSNDDQQISDYVQSFTHKANQLFGQDVKHKMSMLPIYTKQLQHKVQRDLLGAPPLPDEPQLPNMKNPYEIQKIKDELGPDIARPVAATKPLSTFTPHKVPTIYTHNQMLYNVPRDYQQKRG